MNEQPYEYWRVLFARHGYHIFDWLRPQIVRRADVKFWYRYNLFLSVAEERAPALPAAIRASEVPLGERVRDISPWTFKMRKELIRRVPRGCRMGLAARCRDCVDRDPAT